MIHYCTLFDSNYLSRGLLLYESLIKHQAQARLFIFAFDDKCHSLLKEMNLSNATIISLEEFEDEKLLAVKSSRTVAEYCWTCTPAVIEYCIKKYNLPSCTYLDADLFFYSDPSVLNNEMPEDHSVLITSHRYTPQYDQSATSGIYCVQFMTFKNNEDGMKVLEWWRDACIEWCYNRVENGKFGDQKYLDDWPERFKGIVWSLENIGGGAAPWNVQQYTFSEEDHSLKGVEISSGKKFDMIFFHFHGVSFKQLSGPFGDRQMINFRTGYDIPVTAEKLVYIPYSEILLAKGLDLQQNKNLPIVYAVHEKITLKNFIKQKIKKILIN